MFFIFFFCLVMLFYKYHVRFDFLLFNNTITSSCLICLYLFVCLFLILHNILNVSFFLMQSIVLYFIINGRAIKLIENHGS